MLSSLAIVLLPLILMLGGCGSPELLAPVAFSEMPGISKGPGFQATSQSQESQGQETSQSQELRQLLATGNPIPQTECSYQCSRLGFHNGGNCDKVYDPKHGYSRGYFCKCLVEHREEETLWNGWLSEGICSRVPTHDYCLGVRPPIDPHNCTIPRQPSNLELWLCSPPAFGERHSESVCRIWAMTLARPGVDPEITHLRIGKDKTHACVLWADIAYACSKG